MLATSGEQWTANKIDDALEYKDAAPLSKKQTHTRHSTELTEEHLPCRSVNTGVGEWYKDGWTRGEDGGRMVDKWVERAVQGWCKDGGQMGGKCDTRMVERVVHGWWKKVGIIAIWKGVVVSSWYMLVSVAASRAER